ncbi:hypothetical protein E3N88_23405 [Mikania micrantha]|uniref:Uncharacterized protein n=1 Tax=Mikania micrantha TaxID=192012 RepID=A0A5N6NDF7_9ASTR|nr:hypothetical protein E3N88_23405 [Mikania micrantha]
MASKTSNECDMVSDTPGVSPDIDHQIQALRVGQTDERRSFLIRAHRLSGDLRVRLKVFCGLIRSPTFVIQDTCESCAIVPRTIGVFGLLCHVSH